MDEPLKTADKDMDRDEDQIRRDEAAKAIFRMPQVYAKLHEFDEACQTEGLRM
jgi:hypothetical protein